MEPVHRRLIVDRNNWDGRARHHNEVDRPFAQDLVGDVDLAALRVSGPWSLRHGDRLCPASIRGWPNSSCPASCR